MLFSKFVLNETNQHNFSLWNFVDVSRKKNETISYHNLEDSEKVGLKLNIQKTKIMASGPITSWEIDGEIVSDFIFWGTPKSLQMVIAAMKLKDAYSLEGKLWPT